MQNFGQAVENCESMGEDIESLEEMLNYFIDPLDYAFTLGENLMVNGEDILNDMWNAV